MSKQKITIVFDCGATNVKAVAVNETGDIIASKSYPNNTQADPYYPEYRIWDVNEIWGKMCLASKEVVSNIDTSEIIGVTVTTFGVDGVLFDKSGKLLYPMISWQCDRTAPIMAGLDKYMPLQEIYAEAAILPYNFNTINKIIWLAENRPQLVNQAHRFLFAPSVFLYFLSGNMKNDITMAGTSMMTSKKNRIFSEKILGSVGVTHDLFGPLSEPGEVIGHITGKASIETSLPKGISVVATGHDTQFAIFGSGAGKHQPVLSSGTWEILMVRSDSFLSGQEQFDNDITTEFDPVAGFFNIGNQWIASGMLEWGTRILFHDLDKDKYENMISGAQKVAPGSNGVRVIPRFYEESDGVGGGQFTGLTMETTRYEIYRAMLESLALRLRVGKESLEKAGRFKTDSILCVGGGSRNRLWNQLRADISGVEIRVIDKSETTVLGASMFVMYAAGLSESPEEARSRMEYRTEIYKPSANSNLYKELFSL